MSARQTALNVLVACRKQGAWSNGALKERIGADRLDQREAALATRLCYGVIQNRGKLDFYLTQLLRGRVKDLHPVVRDILHLGLYQIYELDRIPDAAAVNEAVTLTKKYCRFQKNAPGLVNAVLRNAIRMKDTIRQPSSLADQYSHPQELIDLLAGYVGQERLEPMLAANNTAPETVIQVNTLSTTTQALMEALARENIKLRQHAWMPDCLILSSTGNLERLEAFQKGDFYVQDAAARLSVLCAALPAGGEINVLDCCAAPGGKSFAAAIALGGKGSIISCDIHPHKVELLQRGAARLGLSNIQAVQQDATQKNPDWIGKMDAVLADVPCSGYGIIRKKPDIRYKTPTDTAQLPALQLKILMQQADYIKPGGILIYSTCTLVRAENEDVVEAFLQKRPDFVLEPLPLPTPLPENTSGCLALIPGEYDTDGFFISRLRRKL